MGRVVRTWDGKEVAAEAPFGVAIVVWRSSGRGVEFLLLHRAHNGPDYEGDWAWTTPSGARLPAEGVDECAKRELREEAGLVLPVIPVSRAGDWALYLAEAHPRVDVAPEDELEHDRHEWVSLEVALRRVTPEVVAKGLQETAGAVPGEIG